MKKNVIALAVAAAMAAPLAAQAEVTVSGQLQAELSSLTGDTVQEGLYLHDAQQAGTPDKGNFGALNFSATEDLGNGMKALAKIGLNIWAPDTNTKGVKTRDAYVGLTGGFGTVLAGTMSSPYKSSTVKWDPFLASAAQARGNYAMSDLHNGYVENAIAYANKFGPAKVVAALVIDEAADDENAGETSGDHAISLSVNVPVGPIEVAFAYQDTSDFGTTAGSPAVGPTAGPDGLDGTADDTAAVAAVPASETGDNTAMKLGAKYSAGPIGAVLQYETIDTGLDDNTDHLYLNGTYTMGANTFALAYGQVDNGGDATPNYVSLGMVHSFSKSTSAHVAYIGLDDDADATNSGVTAGLRVKF